jgi:hypothetical protein
MQLVVRSGINEANQNLLKKKQKQKAGLAEFG